MMLLVWLDEVSGFFRIDPLRAAAENTAFVICVMEFGTELVRIAARPQK